MNSPNPSMVTFKNPTTSTLGGNLLEFWQWAFSDLCDDDIKGIFAEWMVRSLLGLSLSSARRISWANSDIVVPHGSRVTGETRVEVKASALWQSWKLINEDGSSKNVSGPREWQAKQIRFCGLQSRQSLLPTTESDVRGFKSDLYVFCFQAEDDPNAWDAWDLAQWEFYMTSREELIEHKIGSSISLATLRKLRPAMSAAEFQVYAKKQLAARTAIHSIAPLA